MYLVKILVLFTSLPVLSQEGRGDLRFVFYNVENLFDPFDDSLTLDNEFTSGGERNWNWDRFVEKEQRICKTLAAVGGWEPPELIGLCEVENRFVLNWLTRKTPLLKHNYRIIHLDSPDDRGMDVALLYLPSEFHPLERKFLPVNTSYEGQEEKVKMITRELVGKRDSCDKVYTRDILYVKGLVREKDTLHLVICHWPSRWEGYLESMQERLLAAVAVKRLIDSLWKVEESARILVAGDLNDEPTDPSISKILRVQLTGSVLFDTCLYSLFSPRQLQHFDRDPSSRRSPPVTGTLKYRDNWYKFDHILASGGILNDTLLFVKPGGERIFAPGFLLITDPNSTGQKPFRTYNGYHYIGGFSDHLPVYIDLWMK